LGSSISNFIAAIYRLKYFRAKQGGFRDLKIAEPLSKSDKIEKTTISASSTESHGSDTNKSKAQGSDVSCFGGWITPIRQYPPLSVAA
jgi:hypothetical protein